MPRHLRCALLLAMLAAVVSAQLDERWRKANDRGNRWEGLIGVQVGSPAAFELLSFVGHREPLEDDAELSVRFFLPVGSTASIESRELLEEEQYRMLAKPVEWTVDAWNVFEKWSTSTVLSREKIPLSNLGILVRLDSSSSGGPELAPALVYHSAVPRTLERYTVHLRSASTLDHLRFTLLRRADDGDKEVARGALAGRQLAAQPIELELEVAGFAEGLMVLHVEASYPNRPGGPTGEYRFYHRPLPSRDGGGS